MGLVTDSNLFGDERLREFDHYQLWLNLVYWLSLPRFGQRALKHAQQSIARQSAHDTRQQELVTTVNTLRALQNANGSVDAGRQGEAGGLVDTLLGQFQLVLGQLDFDHQSLYFDQLHLDFRAWVSGGFAKPDFGAALAAFRPETQRVDGIEHLVVFPMYTPNASSDTRFEVIVLRTPWPGWLSDLERRTYHNPKFVPGHLLHYTQGYASQCAVLFPETVSVLARATNQFGVIFCDREAQRLQSYALRAADTLGLNVPPELQCLLHSMPMLLDTLALWDLIHDASHSLGELPFDPFMIRQRAPFWVYGLKSCGWICAVLTKPLNSPITGSPLPGMCAGRSCSTGFFGSRSPARGCATTTR